MKQQPIYITIWLLLGTALSLLTLESGKYFTAQVNNQVPDAAETFQNQIEQYREILANFIALHPEEFKKEFDEGAMMHALLQGRIPIGGPSTTVPHYFDPALRINASVLNPSDARYIYLSTAISMFTYINAPPTAVAPGDDICIRITSGGEIIGFGERFYDSPPITFFNDGRIVADTGGLVDLKERIRPGAYGTGTDVSTATSSWKDFWSVHLDDGSKTNLVQCSTTLGTQYAHCTISPAMSPGNVELKLVRLANPFLLGGLFMDARYIKDIYGKFSYDLVKFPMISSAEITIDPNAPKTNGSCEGTGTGSIQDNPSPSPSITVTPTPTSNTSTPTFQPTFTPAPSPVDGDSTGEDIFQTDGT